MRHIVCSFWVSRPRDYPKAAPYIKMLKVLDASCKRYGFEHVVLTDWKSESSAKGAGLTTFAGALPRNLLQATTEIQAQWIERGCPEGADTIFVGADSIVLRDFRSALFSTDLSIVFMGHKNWWIMNGFIHVPATSRCKGRGTFRRLAQETRDLPASTCDDMMAWERILTPKPLNYGVTLRAGLSVPFLPLNVWNRPPLSPFDDGGSANVFHFFGADSKKHFFSWAKLHGYA